MPDLNTITMNDLPAAEQREVERLAILYQRPPHRMRQVEAMRAAFREVAREWQQKQMRNNQYGKLQGKQRDNLQGKLGENLF